MLLATFLLTPQIWGDGMAYYYNAAGRRFILPEQVLEPPDCCGEYEPEPYEDEYDRAEDEMNGIFNRN